MLTYTFQEQKIKANTLFFEPIEWFQIGKIA